MNRDIYQKIASLSDDRTALAILATNNDMNRDIYYSVIFGNRYPDLIKYRKDGESLRHLYLRMLEIIGLLQEELNIIYGEGNPEEILLKKYGDVNGLLVGASKNGKLKLIKWALKNGANIHAKNDDALKSSAEHGRLEVVKYLVEQGADIDKSSALIYASLYGHLDVVKYLVERGANIHIDKEDALKAAIEYGKLEIVKYLVEHGANTYVDLEYSLKEAKEHGHLEVIKYLQEK